MKNKELLSSEINQALKNVPKSDKEGIGIKTFVTCFVDMKDSDFSIKSNVCFNLYASPGNKEATAESYAGYFGYGKFRGSDLTTAKVQELIGDGDILQLDCSSLRARITSKKPLFIDYSGGEVNINLLQGNEQVNINNVVYYCKKMHFGTAVNSNGESCIFRNFKDVILRYIEVLYGITRKDIYNTYLMEKVDAIQVVLPFNNVLRTADDDCKAAIILMQKLLIETLCVTVFGYKIPDKIALDKIDSYCCSLSQVIESYEVSKITPEYIKLWVEQFQISNSHKAVILDGLIHIFKRKQHFITENMLINNLEEFFAGNALGAFDETNLYNDIKNTEFLDIQYKSQSQKNLIKLTNRVLEKHYNGLTNIQCKSNKDFLYIDDVTYTGTSIIKDIVEWLKSGSIQKNSRIIIYVYAAYTKAIEYINTFTKNYLEKEYEISIDFYFSREINNDTNKGKIEVLNPTYTEDRDVKDYIIDLMNRCIINKSKFKYNPKSIYRRAHDDKSKDELFKNTTDRDIMEKVFLKQGIKLVREFREIHKSSNAENIRPLGFNKKLTLGFGSMLVTYRNVPNNCPMVLWFEGKTWKPLFRRNDPHWNI